MAEPVTAQADVISPTAAIRNPTDARLLLALWIARRAFFPLLWLGLAIAGIVLNLVRHVGIDELNAELQRLGEQGDLLAALLSPFAGIAFALLWRLLVALVALGAAYPLAHGHRLPRSAGKSRFSIQFRTWWDRLFLTRGYRAMRWTWAVRLRAAELAPREGRIADLAERILRWLGWVLFVGWIAIWIAGA